MAQEQGALSNRFKRQSVTYPLAGALIAAGAPLGLLCMRRFVLGHHLSIREEIRSDLATYAYLATSTTLVFTLLGRALGRYADRLTELSTTDGLTGLLNPRAFYGRLEQEIERSRRAGSSMTLLLLDLDYLKALNDQYGHAAGDKALETIARAIRREMRSIDAGARLGGDEFGLLAVGTDSSAARTVADRLQTTIAGLATDAPGRPITASIGVITFDPLRDRLDDEWALMRVVDLALYRAKKTGRNRVAFGTLAPRERP
jgi:diguanylate cyclase (GGDEF)-like protein